MLVHSIQTGTVQTLAGVNPGERPWKTATFKLVAPGPVRLGLEGFTGDEHADAKNHGGRDKAALVYSLDHYAAWEREVFHQPLPEGAFGENILVSGLTEGDVCVGDVFAVGQARVQISQPRQPCWKQARRWNMPDLALRMIQTCRSGWYLRVLEEGAIQAGDRFALVERPHANWTVAAAHHVMHFERDNADRTAELASLSTLADAWKRELRKRLAH